MGKATIQSESGSGQYSVTMKYAGRAALQNRIVILNARISELQTQYDGMPETTPDEIWDKQIVGLQIKALGKNVAYLTSAFPADVTLDAWCVDLTEGLTGDVGFIEIPGEYQDSTKVNLVAGYSGESSWNQSRDGQLHPSVALGPWRTFLNKCMLPGWQKFSPLHRYGTIVADSIDFDNDTCEVCLDPEHSSQLNLIVNQGQDFAECKSITYPQFTNFCSRNPTHPTCTNTEVPSPMFISDDQIAFLKSINKSVNDAHEYQTDQSGYRVGDYWTIMGSGDKGDCEDFALTKMQALIDAGYAVKNLQLAAVGTGTFVDHAVLIIQTVNRGTLVLDNRYEAVKEATTLPYRFTHFQRAGTDWRYFATKLSAVPIDYMDCNAAAFADGDEVVVEFTNQDFSQPKVIGFKENPNSCTLNHLAKAGGYFGQDEEWIYTYSGSNDTFTVRDQYPDFNRYASTLLMINRKAYLIAGRCENAPFCTGNLDFNYELDCDADTWQAKADYVSKASYMACFPNLDGKGHVFAGRQDSTGITAPYYWSLAHNAYDPVGDSWAAKASYPEYIQRGFYWVIGGKGYHGGGEYWQSGIGYSIRSAIRAYDPASDGWSAVGNFGVGWYMGYSFSINERAYFGHGAKLSNDGAMDIVNDPAHFFTQQFYYYDTIQDANVQIANLVKSPLSKSSAGGIASADLHGYTLGGSHAFPSGINIYDETMDSWAEGAGGVKDFHSGNFGGIA